MKIKRPGNTSSTQNLSNDFLQYAEDVSSANINLKRALINNDCIEIRRNSLKPNIQKMSDKFQFYH